MEFFIGKITSQKVTSVRLQEIELLEQLVKTM